MTDIYKLIDIIIFGFGIYALYSARELQTKKRIIPTFLIGRQFRPEDCKDVEKFSLYLTPRLEILAISMIIYGVLAVINDYFVPIGTLVLICSIVMFVIMIWYGISSKKAMDAYF